MNKLIILFLMILISNINLAQDCRKMRITVLQLDTSSSKNHAYLTFYSSDKLLKQIWWNKKEYPTRKFEIGKTYKLKLSKLIGMHSMTEDGKVYIIRSCRAKEYYADNVKREDYEICK